LIQDGFLYIVLNNSASIFRSRSTETASAEVAHGAKQRHRTAMRPHFVDKPGRETMKTAVGKAVLIALTGSVAALASFAAQADVAACRALIGFDTTNSASPVISADPATAWNQVAANGDSFLGNKKVANCEVKVVSTTGARKPPTSVFVAGPMAQDECSMFNYLSATDSKLGQGKIGEATTIISSMIAKIDNLNATGKLVDPGYTDIGDAAVAVQLCILNL